MTKTYEADTLSIRIPVKVGSSSTPLDLTGAEIEVFAKRNNQPAIQGSVLVTEPETGVLVASFEPETFQAASYRFQCRITKGGVTQTVVDTEIVAKRSLRT
jgi:hypothetical protein